VDAAAFCQIVDHVGRGRGASAVSGCKNSAAFLFCFDKFVCDVRQFLHIGFFDNLGGIG
jgi:hypothetical protein